MHLRLDLEEYFKYHLPNTPERIALHSADVYACEQCTMFLNKGVTLDSLANAKLNP